MPTLIENQISTSLSVIATTPTKPNKISKTSRTPDSCQLTSARAVILNYLITWRFGTTFQLWKELQRGKLPRQTRRDLERLREAGLVSSFKIYTERDGNNELCWLITKPGVEKMGARYGNHYAQRPSRARIFLRDMELELARTVKLAGWKLIPPTSYSPSKPMPKQTAQYRKLAETINALETIIIRTALQNGQISQSSQTYINYKEQQHLWGLPGQVNDYVAYVEGVPGAVIVLMLCPPNTGQKKWEARLEKYAKIAKYVRVYGVFANEETRVIGQEILKSVAADQKNKRLLTGYGANLKTTTLPELYDLLDEILATIPNQS